MSNIVKMTSRKFLIRDLNKNIELGTNKCFEFNGFRLYRDGETGYKILDKDGDDIGTYDISEINDYLLKTKLSKETKKTYSGIKSKPRKVKNYDVVSNEFMGFVKEQQCIVDGCTRTNIEAHHIYGRQPARHDNLCVPLCSYHHRGSEFSVHEGNVRDFRKRYTREEMELIALVIFKKWIDDTNPGEFYEDLYEYLKNTKERHTKAIKEFLIGRNNSKKKG